MRLSTHSRVFSNPLTMQEAKKLITSWIKRPNVRLLVPGSNHIESVCSLFEQAGTAGNLVSEARIAALVLEYGATIHTADTDFVCFTKVDWENPLV